MNSRWRGARALLVLVLAASCGGSDDPFVTGGPATTARPPAAIEAAVPSTVTSSPVSSTTLRQPIEPEAHGRPNPRRAPSATPPASTVVATDAPYWCSYVVSDWSVSQRRSVNHRLVGHLYVDNTADEVDPFDPRCSACEQDQVAIDPSAFGLALQPFEVCWAYEDGIRRALGAIVSAGDFDIVEISGYRPGFTRGDVVGGVRTVLSNHSYGTAVDINAGANGLYRGCDVVSVDIPSIATCRLGIGGPWDRQARPRTSITAGGTVVTAFTQHLGWRWGGADGVTRDLMHFSLSGN